MFEQFFKTISDPERNLTIDYCRAAAIVSVVLYHFDFLPYGYLGVDLFFVISGFLVSRPLLDAFRGEKPIEVKEFIIRRAFKIWPSYYFFIFAGLLFAWFFYRETRPQEIITWQHLPRYLFFFLNYRGLDHWSFDHLWSICVEEHFYILLPLGFLLLSLFTRNSKVLLLGLLLTIITGNALRVLSYTIGFETHSATHNRIDALTLGVLLSFLLKLGHVKSWSKVSSAIVALFGTAIIGTSIYAHQGFGIFFEKVVFLGLVPFGFFLIIFGLLNIRMPSILPIRFLAYFSYNWYLWHPIFIYAIQERLGKGPAGLAIYLFCSLGMAVLVTLFVEEPILKLRSRFLRKAAA